MPAFLRTLNISPTSVASDTTFQTPAALTTVENPGLTGDPTPVGVIVVGAIVFGALLFGMAAATLIDWRSGNGAFSHSQRSNHAFTATVNTSAARPAGTVPLRDVENEVPFSAATRASSASSVVK